MVPVESDNWARLRLVQGESNVDHWELISSRGQTLVSVGSSPSCSWQVREEGVAPLHVSLHWDGESLRVADSHGAGGVRLDGRPLGLAWERVSGRARIEFGRAAIVAETSAPAIGRSTQPLDLSPMPPPSEQARVSAASPPPGASRSQYPKATLLGVAPAMMPSGTPSKTPSSNPPPSGQRTPSSNPPGASASVIPQAVVSTGGSASFRPKRPSETARPTSDKPTMMGMPAVGYDGAGPTSGASSSNPPPGHTSGAASRRDFGATLMGVGASERPGAAELGFAPTMELDAAVEQRYVAQPSGRNPELGKTLLGYADASLARPSGVAAPSRSQPPGGRHVDTVRNLTPGHAASRAAGDEIDVQGVPVGAVWTEAAPGAPADVVGPGVIVTPGRVTEPELGAPAPGGQPWPNPTSERPPRPSVPSEAPESIRPTGRTVLRYVLLTILIGAAYAGWIYLLDRL